MSGEIRIRAEDVWKAYPRWPEQGRSLKALAGRRLPALVRPGEPRYALRDVGFEVEAGAMLGVIGHNGAGKSTLLRVLAGIVRPTRGRVQRVGDTAAILSLGDLFDPDLSGRENLVTTAIGLGLREREARRAVPAMLEFAELAAVADAPVRTYSDGMRLRLAFGAVSQLRPRALLLDEILAVGDLAFQHKCVDWIGSLRDGGTSVVFASHSLEQVTSLCTGALWLHDGRLREAGPAERVVEAYRGAMQGETMRRTPVGAGADGALELRRNRFGTQEVQIRGVRLLGPDGAPVESIEHGRGVSVAFELHPNGGVVRRPIVGVSVIRLRDGVVCYDASTEADAVAVPDVGAVVPVVFDLPRLDLIPDRYVLDVGVYAADWSVAHDYHSGVYELDVVGRRPDGGVVRLAHAWRVG